MKKAAILLCALILVLISATFSGCGAPRPHEIKWYLYHYYIDGEYYHNYVGFDDYNHFNAVYSDRAEISFKKDGSFYFKDIEGTEFEGTYKSKKRRYQTEVTLNFPDGSTAYGEYYKFDRNDTEYQISFHIYGVSYYFDNTERKFFEEDYLRCLKNLSSAIYTYANNGRMEPEHYPYFDNLKRAQIGRIGESFVAVAGANAYAFDRYNYWCYTVNGESIDKCEIREGDCIIRTTHGGFAIYYPEIG